MAKVKQYDDVRDGSKLLAFHCPGCGYDHGFRVGGHGPKPRWTWNGSFDAPTFSPSLLCNQDSPANRCHSFVKEGRIEFLSDCFHDLRGMTVDLPDFEAA